MLVSLMLFLLFSGPKGPPTSPLPKPVRLDVSESKTLDLPSFGTFGEAQSDENGNLYFHAGTSHYYQSVVLGAYPAKSQPVVFSLPDEMARSTAFASFYVSRSGEVYILTKGLDVKDDPPQVFAFDHEGKLRSQIELQVPEGVALRSLTVFSHSESMLVSGFYRSAAASQRKGARYVALVAPSGKVLRELTAGDGVDLKNVGQFPQETWSCIGDDGNLYLLEGNQIRVLQESGKVFRQIKVNKPTETSFATKLVVSQGVVAVWLNVDPKEGEDVKLNFETIDLSNGDVTGLYYPAEALGNKAVNFTRQDGFVFVDSDKGRMRLLTAKIP